MTGPASSTTVGELREKAAPWLTRPTPAPPGRTVDTTDRADWAVWDQISHDCRALNELDADLATQYGATGLVADLWMSAYAQDPQLREAADTPPAQRANRAITAAMLGTPEHDEMRAATIGDPYAAAMSVLAQAATVRQMLRELDPYQRQRQAQQARAEADAAAQNVARMLSAAQDAAAEAAGAGGDGEPGEDTTPHGAGGTDAQQGGDPSDGTGEPGQEAGQDGQGEPAEGEDTSAEGEDTSKVDRLPVPRPELVDVQRAIAEASAADEDAARAEQAAVELGAGDENGDQAMLAVRAAARQACADAAEALEAEATAMNAWGVGPGERERMDPNARMKLARKLQTGKLKKFAQLVGRFQQMAQAQRAHRVEHARGEYVGVTIGDDLTSLIPAELVNLALPTLRAQFAVRYAEKQLMVYEQRGEENEGQGAVIVCIDCSDSMRKTDDHGISGEAYSKALALALLEQARDATPVREYAAILFSRDVDATFVFPADEPVNLAARIRLAETFSAGGTEFMPPLTTALQLLEAEYNTTGRQRADIVFITDGLAHLSEPWLERWHEQKKRLGFRCFGIQVGRWAPDGEDPAELLDSFCDDVRRIDDLADTHATADIFRAV
ncbi:vWA domain-containing protein [Amycolatopsis sacchari]|uniref:vWA domain-containing protein n=1 Tax=Amycolatopsis sacchari TaxID=115433 RepID=UPI003D7588B4